MAGVRVGLNVMYVGGGVAGGRVYADGLLRGLAAGHPADDEFAVFARRDTALPDLPHNFRVVRAPVGGDSTVGRTLWEYGELPRAAARSGCRLLHGLGTISPPPAGRTPFVLTVHDLGYRHFPQSQPVGYRAFLRLAAGPLIRRADRVIVPSQATAADVVKVHGVDPGRVRVVPYGGGQRLRPADPGSVDAVLTARGVGRPYLLSVARGYPHKNLGGLLDAFARLPAGPRLVLVGERYMVGPHLERRIDRLGLRGRVTATGFVPAADLAALYAGAAAFAFPSLMEGFGLPVLEAMACGCPVVGSAASAVPEAVGDAGLVADATDPGAFAAALDRVLSDPALAADLRARGLARAAGFTWERCAAGTAAVYREFG